jgi:hypothetical protein
MEEHRAIFLGRNTVFIAWTKIEGKQTFFKIPNKWVPFISKWQPVLSNVKRHMEMNYQERTLVDLNTGRTDEKVRIYHFDVDNFEAYYADMNPSNERLLRSLHAERDMLFAIVDGMDKLLKNGMDADRFMAHFKDQHDFYVNQIKPGYMFNPQLAEKKK